MQAERFRPLVESKGPYESVYYDDSHDTEDAPAQRDLKWRAMREELEQHGASAEVVEILERAVVDSPRRSAAAAGR